jgi:predicted phage terminase large subunit-like protein
MSLTQKQQLQIEKKNKEIDSQPLLESVKDMYNWRAPINARKKQIAPQGNWTNWLILAGRGFGKTRTGAEWIRERVENGLAKRIAIIGKTPADVRDVMIEGESGIISISPPWNKPDYQPSRRRIIWPNGSVAHIFSSYEPDQLRGPQFDTAWCDELASWEYIEETWDNLMFGLRLGEKPQVCITTTPRSLQLLKNIRDLENTIVTTGSSYENKKNLNANFFTAILSKYKNTRLGMQEIYAEILEESEGALWKREWFEDSRLESYPTELERIVIAIDPAVTATKTSDETGIIVAGKDIDGNYYIINDSSGRYSPKEWADLVISLFDRYTADIVVAETNNGGQLVEHTLRTQSDDIPFKSVHASRGKRTRAEPIAALYEQKKVFHCGVFTSLEDQLCNWEALSGDPSPDRLDAMVWALTELSGAGNPAVRWL